MGWALAPKAPSDAKRSRMRGACQRPYRFWEDFLASGGVAQGDRFAAPVTLAAWANRR